MVQIILLISQVYTQVLEVVLLLVIIQLIQMRLKLE